MPDKPEQPSRFDFDPFAVTYDSWYETAEGTLFDHLEKRALRRILEGVPNKGSLLEIGAGTGWWSRFFSDAGFAVTGIDISPRMVDIARSKKIPNATFKLADAHELPYADESFSCAAAVTSIEFTRNPEKVLSEMIRCTSTEGTLFFGVLNAWSPFNAMRRKQPDGPFASARLFDPKALHDWLSPYGEVTTTLCAFPFSLKMPIPLSGAADDFSAFMGNRSGAFIAGKVVR